MEAALSALAMQSGMARRNKDDYADCLASNSAQLQSGGGRHCREGDVFGDGVNIAARLSRLRRRAACLSEDAYRQVRGKLEIPIADAGEQKLKNISNPIKVYRIEPSVAAAIEPEAPLAQPRRRSPVWASAGAAIAAAIALAAITWFSLPRAPTSQGAEPKPIASNVIPSLPCCPCQSNRRRSQIFAGVTGEVISARALPRCE
jgi:hypothetical protein